jgi:hypothetical protein
MDIGPLEYVVIGLPSDQFATTILPELHRIQQRGLIRVVDLLFVRKDTAGRVDVREVSELCEEEQPASPSLLEDLSGLLSTQDIEQLAGEITAESEAIVVLLEHTWTLGLAEAVRQAGGVLFTGGMVTPEALTHVRKELATAREEHDA